MLTFLSEYGNARTQGRRIREALVTDGAETVRFDTNSAIEQFAWCEESSKLAVQICALSQTVNPHDGGRGKGFRLF